MKPLGHSNLRILIADDQPDVLEALRLLLKAEGYQIESAASPAAILSAIEARRPARHLDALVGAACVFGQRSRLHIEVNIVPDKQIEMPIFVVIQKGAAWAKRFG